MRKRKSPYDIPEHLKWILDSGAFQELRLYGRYTFTPEEYFEYALEKKPDFFVNMDYMCEPSQLLKTGLTVEEHQKLSIENQITLGDLADEHGIELIGTIQGWDLADYLDHIDMLKESDTLRKIMGIGSICRRSADKKILQVLRIIRRNLPSWIKLHGFGVKTTILQYRETYNYLDMCDSMAWSYEGRMKGVKKIGIGGSLNGKPCLAYNDLICNRNSDDCANCGLYMRKWAEKIETLISKKENQLRITSFINEELKG